MAAAVPVAVHVGHRVLGDARTRVVVWVDAGGDHGRRGARGRGRGRGRAHEPPPAEGGKPRHDGGREVGQQRDLEHGCGGEKTGSG